MYRDIEVLIDNNAIKDNATVLSEAFPHRWNIAVIKGNAYGHGYGIVPSLIEGGMNAFAVSSLDEALKVREFDKTHPVILLQPVSENQLNVCSKENISVCVNDSDTFRKIVDSKENLKLQFKVNCGMNRLGYKDGEHLYKDIEEASKNERLIVEGLFSHFHTSGLTDKEYSENKKKFLEITKDIDLGNIPMVHIDKTTTVLLHDTLEVCNGARFGISLYGFASIYPYDSSVKGNLLTLRRNIKNKLHGVEPCKELKRYPLKPAFSLVTKVIQINEITKGQYVGYGLLHKAKNDERIAVIDVGYADGIGRKRTGSKVCINDKKYPIIGEVGMGMCEVLVDDNVKKGDRVTVLGGEISIRGIAAHLGTTTYETLTNINSLIPRHYL